MVFQQSPCLLTSSIVLSFQFFCFFLSFFLQADADKAAKEADAGMEDALKALKP